MGRELKRAEMKFLLGALVCPRQSDQRELRLRVLPPDREIFGRHRQPAKPEHVPAGLGYPADLLPCDLVDHATAPKPACTTYPFQPHEQRMQRAAFTVTMDSVAALPSPWTPFASVTGICSTVARWPSQSCVTSTWLPSGNSIAS